MKSVLQTGVGSRGAVRVSSPRWSQLHRGMHVHPGHSRLHGVSVFAAIRPAGFDIRTMSSARPTTRGRRSAVRVSAIFEQFTDRSIEVAMMSQQLASKYQAAEVRLEHVLLGLVAEDSLSRHGYMDSGLSVEKAAEHLHHLFYHRWGSPPHVHESTEGGIPFSSEVRDMFKLASTESKLMGFESISPEHILIATLGDPQSYGKLIFTRLGVDTDSVKAEAMRRLMDIPEPGNGRIILKEEEREEQEENAAEEEEREEEEEAPAPSQSMLEVYCTDMCEEVQKKRLDPLIGREKEVKRVIQILGCRRKNNPILLGEPGVGKTAVAEGLAYAVLTRTCPGGDPLPDFLLAKRIMMLDLTAIIADAKERGELERRCTQLVDELKADGDTILVIDEVHRMVGAGLSTRGGKGGGNVGVSISKILLPALASGEVQVVAATTLREHRLYFEGNRALSRRFQPIILEPPSAEATLKILQGLQTKYETHHRCAYSREALEACVDLSSRYIPDRHQPDKAIDLMDEAGSKARIRAHSQRPVNTRESPQVAEFLQTLELKESAIADGRYEDAHDAWVREKRFRGELVRLLPPLEAPAGAWPAPQEAPAGPAPLAEVTVADIESVVARWSGIPVERLSDSAARSLNDMAHDLKQVIIGQDDAVDIVSAALRRSFAGIKDPNRPIASLLFVGPTGVGKTELVKALTQRQFGSLDALIRIDMSEYMERHSVSKLLGAPPGYDGYGEGGQLTEAVRRRPFCVVLFDEIEKAHPDVFNILLQIMEDGRVNDSMGRLVSFKHAMIILTSNVSSRQLSLLTRSGLPSTSSSTSDASAGTSAMRGGEEGVGYEMGSEEAEYESGPEAKRMLGRMRAMVLEEVKGKFRPELLNRLDELVLFQKLGRRDVSRIASIMVGETRMRVSGLGHRLEIAPRIMACILAEGYSEEYGARLMRKAITRLIEDHLSEEILAGHVGERCLIHMDMDAHANVVLSLSPGMADSQPHLEDSERDMNNIMPYSLAIDGVQPNGSPLASNCQQLV